ncbi:hypothetical protein SK128_007307 [Halocaridina rubra]|uniref:Uncharacterized protein n=1 Tax=Halocaridina rubra TaxID=373956 RepID=A0AAN8XNE4_HALRR
MSVFCTCRHNTLRNGSEVILSRMRTEAFSGCVCTCKLPFNPNRNNVKYPGHLPLCFRNDEFCYCSGVKLLMAPQLQPVRELTYGEVIHSYSAKQMITPQQIIEHMSAISHPQEKPGNLPNQTSRELQMSEINKQFIAPNAPLMPQQVQGQSNIYHSLYDPRLIPTIAQKPPQQYSQHNIAAPRLSQQAMYSSHYNPNDPRVAHLMASQMAQANLAVNGTSNPSQRLPQQQLDVRALFLQQAQRNMTLFTGSKSHAGRTSTTGRE